MESGDRDFPNHRFQFPRLRALMMSPNCERLISIQNQKGDFWPKENEGGWIFFVAIFTK
jgi:hypothetical protein